MLLFQRKPTARKQSGPREAGVRTARPCQGWGLGGHQGRPGHSRWKWGRLAELAPRLHRAQADGGRGRTTPKARQGGDRPRAPCEATRTAAAVAGLGNGPGADGRWATVFPELTSPQLRSPVQDQVHLLARPGQSGHDPIPLRSGDPTGAQLRKGLAGKGLAVAESVGPRQSQGQTGEGQQGNPAGSRGHAQPELTEGKGGGRAVPAEDQQAEAARRSG